MKPIKHIFIAAALLVSASFSPMIATAEEELPKVAGEIRKIKLKSGKITIRHEAIPNLDMPGMSMVFRIEEGLDISALEKGDKVEFTVVDKDGKMVIMSIDKTETE